MPELKHIHLKDIALTETGSVKAVFATLNVVDHDEDIVMSGAIENGAKVRISAYNHASWGGALPVGKGTIAEVGNELVFEGQFFMDMPSAMETYRAVKNLADLGEWSFGFDILEKEYFHDPNTDREIRRIKKLKVYEVSPVLLGAGIDTRTLDIKSMGGGTKAFEDHAKLILEAVSEFVERSQSIAELRQKKGKDPASEKNREGLKAIAEGLTKAAGELTRLATPNVETDDETKAAVAALFAQIEINEAMRGIA